MSDTDMNAVASSADRPLRRSREPLLSPLDLAGFAVSIAMVCGPLAMGAFGL